jgi:outer membrane protein TolC
MLSVLAVSPGWAGELPEPVAGPELTLNEALARALTHSAAVSKAEKEIDHTKVWRDYRADQLDFTPLGPPGSAAVEVPWSQLLLADLIWRMSKRSLTTEEDRVALDTCRRYWAVLQAVERERAAIAALAAAFGQRQNTRAGHQVGTLAVAELICCRGPVP